MDAAHDHLVAMLSRLKLTAIRDQLDTLLDEAARSEMTLREALGFLVSREIARRDERRISMASKIAQFPFVRELEGFDWSAQPSLDPRQIRELATCRSRSEEKRSARTTASSSSRRQPWWRPWPRFMQTGRSRTS